MIVFRADDSIYGRDCSSSIVLEEDMFYWFWIGTHDEYERLIGLNLSPFAFRLSPFTLELTYAC